MGTSRRRTWHGTSPTTPLAEEDPSLPRRNQGLGEERGADDDASDWWQGVITGAWPEELDGKLASRTVVPKSGVQSSLQAVVWPVLQELLVRSSCN